MDKEEELVDIDIDKNDNITTGYNHIHSLEDPSGYRGINVEKYLIEL